MSIPVFVIAAALNAQASMGIERLHRQDVAAVIHANDKDGSWRFASVMVRPEKADSAAPMAHPCR